jgi:hypothetical protein
MLPHLIVLSALPDTMVAPSWLKATLYTLLVCPWSVARHGGHPASGLVSNRAKGLRSSVAACRAMRLFVGASTASCSAALKLR